MTSHFRFHDGVGEAVPPNAQYHYPVQASKIIKTQIKIPAKNGPSFRSDQASAPIRIELPAQGYLDPARTFLTFDVVLTAATTTAFNLRIQNNVLSLFRRIRLLYGSLPVEDVRHANVLSRMLTEAVGSHASALVGNQTSIAEGVGGYEVGYPFQENATLSGDGAGTPYSFNPRLTRYNVRLNKIQCAKPFTAPILNGQNLTVNNRAINDGTTPRRYQVQLPLGLFQQPKNIPLKWMAAQLAVELDLASFADCIAQTGSDLVGGSSFTIQDVHLNAELLEFDAVYDAAFLEDMTKHGCPIHFTSWNTYSATPSGGTTQNLQIPERNRSLKAIFNVMLPPTRLAADSATSYPWDSHAMLCGGAQYVDTRVGVAYPCLWQGWQRSYQFRIGGKYAPAEPVNNGTTTYNGGAEADVEFQKALNIVGDYSLSTPSKSERWGPNPNSVTPFQSVIEYHDGYQALSAAGTGNGFVLSEPSFYVTAIALETDAGPALAGLNGEEQNDLSLNMTYSHPLRSDCTYLTFVHYDALLVLRPDNVVELIK